MAPVPSRPYLHDDAPRMLLATVGVGVPPEDAEVMIGALAAQAARLGYDNLVVEAGQVSGTPPGWASGADRLSTPGQCPRCGRSIRRHASGVFYAHRCRPLGHPLADPLDTDDGAHDGAHDGDEAGHEPTGGESTGGECTGQQGVLR